MLTLYLRPWVRSGPVTRGASSRRRVLNPPQDRCGVEGEGGRLRGPEADRRRHGALHGCPSFETCPSGLTGAAPGTGRVPLTATICLLRQDALNTLATSSGETAEFQRSEDFKKHQSPEEVTYADSQRLWKRRHFRGRKWVAPHAAPVQGQCVLQIPPSHPIALLECS